MVFRSHFRPNNLGIPAGHCLRVGFPQVLHGQQKPGFHLAWLAASRNRPHDRHTSDSDAGKALAVTKVGRVCEHLLEAPKVNLVFVDVIQYIDL